MPRFRALGATAAIAATLLAGVPVAAAQVFPGTTWDVVRPEEAGWSAQGLREAYEQFRQMGSTALVIVHNGRMVAGWG
ncbi:MAG: hypothetical protein IT538_11385, partial [Variibacter sp.]|nr:hypothetical protein [Variibacter sp.]